MESTANISEFVENTKIKRALLGGFDRESTYNFLQQLTAMYQQHIKNALSKKEQTDEEEQVFCRSATMLSREQIDSIRADIRNEYEDEISRLKDYTDKLKDDYNDLSIKNAVLEEKLQDSSSEVMLMQAEHRNELAELNAKIAELESKTASAYEPARLSTIELDNNTFYGAADSVTQAGETARKIVSEANAEAEYIKQRVSGSVQEMRQKLDELENIKQRFSDTLIIVNDCLRSAGDEILRAEKEFSGGLKLVETQNDEQDSVQSEYIVSENEDASKAMIEYLAKRMIQYVK